MVCSSFSGKNGEIPTNLTDMQSMSKPVSTSGTTPAVQAANVLRAWIVRDEAAFHREIGRTFEFCSSGSTGFDDENFELLRAVAGSLRGRSLDSDCEPMVHLCINLLIHLAGHCWSDSAVCVPPDSRD